MAAAPSEICELFPAVTDPPFLNAGFSLVRLAIVVSFLTPQSVVTTTSF